MGFKTSLATGLGRLTHWGLTTLFHRSASQLPGRVALALDHDVIAHLATKLDVGSIVVCGTNGKTTTNNIVASALEAQGFKVLCNRAGANMAAGVAAALLPSSRADWAVIEADELSTINILPALKPTYLVLLNLFRDQLDRAGEIDHVQDTIVKALLASPETTLMVCGDDPISMGVARRVEEAGTKVVAFGIAEDLHLPHDRVPEGAFCQVCGEQLHYDYRSYAQLGAFRCPNGDFARPKLAVSARAVRVGRSGVSFEASGAGISRPAELHADFGGVYMVYNLLAAFCAASAAGVSAQTFQQVFDGYKPENGRLQHFCVAGRDVVLNLAKNPTGFNQNISLLLADERPKSVYFVINDNFNDGKDISWIWDVDFERLSGDTMHVFAGGLRAHDVCVRLKYAGIKAPVVASVADALSCIQELPTTQPLYVLCNYSALWPAKAELEALGGQHE